MFNRKPIPGTYEYYSYIERGVYTLHEDTTRPEKMCLLSVPGMEDFRLPDFYIPDSIKKKLTPEDIEDSEYSEVRLMNFMSNQLKPRQIKNHFIREDIKADCGPYTKISTNQCVYLRSMIDMVDVQIHKDGNRCLPDPKCHHAWKLRGVLKQWLLKHCKWCGLCKESVDERVYKEYDQWSEKTKRNHGIKDDDNLENDNQ